MKIRTALIVAAAALAVLPAQVDAALLVFRGTFAGTNEVPSNPSPGTGSVLVLINDVTNRITMTANFSGLVSPTRAAHVHCCAGPPGVNTGIAIEVPSLPGFPLGVTSGVFANSYDLNDPLTYNPAFVTANGGTAPSAASALIAGMQAGRSYFNIHSIASPGGEIRANLAAVVPEPASWAFMIGGFGLVGGVLPRRKFPANNGGYAAHLIQSG